MTIDQVRQKYLDFFISSNTKHKQIVAAPLILENDPTTLFTSAGMQPLVPYLLGEKHPEGKRLVNSQPAIRTQDIEEVGDNRHTTYFEMLGNWSLGDYFKKKQLSWIWEFLTVELGLPKERLYVSVFEGSKDIAPDNESKQIWKELGMSDNHIFEYGDKKNWWSRAGAPDQMPVGEIGGPTSEIFYEFTQVKHDPAYGEKCHPNCDCGRFMEIGNSVFMVYKKTSNGLEELPNKNVDFGGGLERLTAAVNNEPDIFKLEVFQKYISRLEKLVGQSYAENEEAMRIIADHVRAVEALASEGLRPGNKQQGYVMRRLIRRAAIKLNSLKDGFEVSDFELITGEKVILDEVFKFRKTLKKGLRELEKLKSVDGKSAFDLYQTYGFPLELTLELAQEKKQKVDINEFKKAFEIHKDNSRTASAGKFKGGLADTGDETTRLHTVTHLLHAALRQVLGEHVQQKGSNITSERLRFDFVHPEKLTNEEIRKIEDLVNTQIDKNLKVNVQTMSFAAARANGALAFFSDKCGEKVKVYSIGEFSREVCGGPHVGSLSEIGGHVKITKEKSASAGVRRIYAQIK